MAENRNTQTEQAVSQPQEAVMPTGAQSKITSQMVQPRPCPKDCRRCSMQQQICCSSMLSFQSFDVMNGIIQRLDIQAQRITELEGKLQALQPGDGELSSPLPLQGDLFAGTEG